MLPASYDCPVRRILLLVAVVAAAVAVGGSGSARGAARATLIAFRTPSGNIGCVFDSESPTSASLRCDIRTGLRPRPAKPPRCDLDWGDSYTMSPRGRVVLTCHGDTAILPQSHVVRYGTRWSKSGFVCVSRVTGLRCTNRSGHGFFMSRAHSYRF